MFIVFFVVCVWVLVRGGFRVCVCVCVCGFGCGCVGVGVCGCGWVSVCSGLSWRSLGGMYLL
jgi:hypothetical protein